ncbi:MAG: DUF2974 domain-containing protein [Bacilli bacterium]|nr:DUF2974 domain-containing protein [Bacilli bacterium]
MKLLEYIKKNGQYSFDEKPLNGVDKLIFANISYVNYKDTVSSNSKMKKTIKDVCLEFCSKGYDNEYNIMAVRGGIKLLKHMAKCKRYHDLYLYNYQKIVNDCEQFSAITIEINSHLVYVSFEGTTDEMIGWREDFEMCYRFPIPSQKSAIKYLNHYFSFKNVDIILGGHSKGGNLALVSGMCANILVRHKIKEIYNYDGPGLSKRQLNSLKYRKISYKYQHIVPNNSLVGMMLYSEKRTIVKTNYVGMLSHYYMNWEVDDFNIIENIMNKSSINLEKKLSSWIEKYNDKQKKQFVEELFDVFKRNNINSLLDFINKPTAIIKIFNDSTKVSEQTSIMFKEFSNSVRKYLFKTLQETIFKS